MGPYAEIIPGISVNSEADLIQNLDQLDNQQIRNRRLYWLHLTSFESSSYCEKVFKCMTQEYRG